MKRYLFVIVIAVLSGCAIQEADKSITDAKSEFDGHRKTIVEQKSFKAVVTKRRPFFGNKTAARDPEKILPEHLFLKTASYVSKDPVTLEQAVRRLRFILDIPLRIETILGAGGATESERRDSAGVETVTSNQVLAALKTKRAVLSFKGKVRKLLDHVALVFDADWRYIDGTIVFFEQYTKTYRVNLPASNYVLESTVNDKGQGQTGGGGMVSAKLEADLVGEFERSLLLIAGKSDFSLSKNTGLLTVVGSPSLHRQVAAHVRVHNKLFGRRIAIEVAVLLIETSKNDDFGLSFDLLLKDIFKDLSFGFTSLAPTVNTGVQATAAVLPGSTGHFAGSTAVVKALSKRLNIVDQRHLSAVAQHATPVPFNLTRLQDVVRKISVTALAGSDSVSTAIDTETLQLGLTMRVFPRLVEGDRIHLSVDFSSADLVSLEPYSVSGESTVQLATIDERRMHHDVVLRSRERLIVAGFEQQSARREDSGTGLADFWLLGGGKSGGLAKTRMVLILTATLLDD